MQFSTDMDLSRRKPNASSKTSGHFNGSNFSIENITGENFKNFENVNSTNAPERSSTISFPVISADKKDIAYYNLQSSENSDSDEEFESSKSFHTKLNYSRMPNPACEQNNSKKWRFSSRQEQQVFSNEEFKHISPSSESGSGVNSKYQPSSDSESNSNNGSPTRQNPENSGSTLGFEVPSSANIGCPNRMFPTSEPDTAADCYSEDEEELCRQNCMFGMHDSSYSFSSIEYPSSSSPSSSINQTDPGKLQSKTRINYYPTQLKTLEATFNEHPYPNKALMNSLSKSLEIPESKLKVWFQNKRARLRRKHPQSSIRKSFMPPLAPFMPTMLPYPFMPRGNIMTTFPWINHGDIPSGTYQQKPSQLATTKSSEEDTRPKSPSQSTCSSTERPLPMSTFFCPYPYGMYPPYFFGKK